MDLNIENIKDKTITLLESYYIFIFYFLIGNPSLSPPYLILQLILPLFIFFLFQIFF